MTATTNVKIIDGLLEIGTMKLMRDRKVALLSLSKQHGRDTIKPHLAYVRDKLKAEMRVMDSARAKASNLTVRQQELAGLREWIVKGERIQNDLDKLISRITSVVERGGY